MSKQTFRHCLQPIPGLARIRPAAPRSTPVRFLSLLAVLATAAAGQAASVIDSFDDVGGATNGLVLWNLNNTGIGGVGFSTKYEQTSSGVPVLRTNDLVVGVANYVSGQTSFTQHWSVAAVTASSGAARRTQTRSTPTMSGTIWFSFLASLLTTNGDVALTLNGTFGGSGVPSNNSTGMRVGLGSNTRANFRGALGVGPLMATATLPAEITNIVNGVNGAVTAAGFVPVNGTAGLVLGRIDYDPITYYPRVSLWYNPDVPDEASLPAPTLTFSDSTYNIVPTAVTRIGYQVNRSPAPATQNEVIDNVKVSDEPTGFDIVYKNAALPTPSLSVVGTVLVGSEAGPTNLVFTVTSDRAVAAPLTVNYVLTGVATNGYDGMGGFTNADYIDTNFNPGTLTSSVTIPTGQSNATVVLQVIDDALPEGNESVIFTLQASPSFSYILGGSATATGTILDNNDANVSLQYMFTRTPAPQVWDTNMVAAPAVTTGIGNGSYSGAYYISPDASYSAGGNWTANNAADAVANGDYMGLAIAPVAGRSLTLTNLQFMAVYGNYLNQVPGATGAVVFVRSSLDNFTSDLGNFVLLPDNLIFPNIWYSNSVALGSAFSNLPGQVEFRLYIYDDSDNNQVGVRIDNLYFSGLTGPLPAGVNQVSVSTNVINAAEPATPGQFTITRIGDATNPLTVNYTIAGTASNGVDYVFLPGTATFAAGESNAAVTVMPIDDDIPEPTETVVLTLAPGAGYGILPPNSATVNLADDGDLGPGVLAIYFFNENNNAAASLAAVAAPTIKLTNQLAAFNASAGPGLVTFGTFNAGGYHGYGSSVYHSAPSSLYIGNSVLSTNAAGALAGGDYFSFSLAGKPGYALTLTNLSAWLMMRPDGGQTNWVFLRSSLDNFATDLGSFTVPGTTNGSPDPFLQWTVPLGITSYPGAIEFRIYVYSSRSGAGDIFRLDDVGFQGAVVSQPPGSQVVNVVASDPTASEPGIDTGAFTLSRAGDAGVALAVNYGITGTASNGVDYVYLSGTTNFDVGVTNVVISVLPIDDNRPEPTETVILTVPPSANYYLGLTNSATVTIADDGDLTPLFTFAVTDTNAYERVSTLVGSFTLNRTLGDMTTNVTINFTLGGTARLGVDYISSATNFVTFSPGVTTQTITIIPIDNALVDGNRTVILTVQTAPSFILDPPTSGTVTIVDDESAPGTVLWSDNFDTGTSATNYTVKAGSDLGVDDYVADFAFDYSTLGVPPAPGSTNTIGLMLNANALGGAAGVNFYPIGQSFSNDFALRFNLFLSMDPAAGADNEAAYFGINQTGLATNWLSALGSVYTNYGDSIWASVATRDPVPGIATLYAATNAGTAPVVVGNAGNQPDLFNSPPYGQLGRPNNAYTSTNKTWVDCELSQLSGVISLKLNNTVVLQYTNTTPFTNGDIFIGYGDPFASLGSANCFAVFDNVRVVQLVAAAVRPVITGITLTGGTVEITFTAGAGDAASAFKLQTSGAATAGFADDGAATLTSAGQGQFKATIPLNGAMQFYRIRR